MDKAQYWDSFHKYYKWKGFEIITFHSSHAISRIYFLLFHFPKKLSVPSKIITCNFDKWNKLFIYGLSLEAGNLFRGQSLVMTHSSVYILNSQSRTRSQSNFLSIQNLTNTLPDSEFKLFKLEDMGRCRYSNKYVLLV